MAVVFSPQVFENTPGLLLDPYLLKYNSRKAMHYHDCVEIGLCTKGSGVCFVQNKIIPFVQGQITFMNAGEAHIFQSHSSQPSSWLFLYVAPRLTEQMSLPDNGVYQNRNAETIIRVLWDLMQKGGYCADMTRTVSLGEPQAEMRRIYETVLRAQETCEAALAPGKCCRDIDAMAREIIDGAGYAGRFGHGLGHAVGIDIHEEPRLSMLCEDILVPGNTITVEPGIYVPGLGGVRIENTCAITENGARTLVHAQKALLIL